MRRWLALVLLLAVPACSEGSATEQACDAWFDLVEEQPRPSDGEVARRLRGVDLDGVDQNVAGYIRAIAARLEQGDDISTSFAGLNDAC